MNSTKLYRLAESYIKRLIKILTDHSNTESDGPAPITSDVMNKIEKVENIVSKMELQELAEQTTICKLLIKIGDSFLQLQKPVMAWYSENKSSVIKIESESADERIENEDEDYELELQKQNFTLIPLLHQISR